MHARVWLTSSFPFPARRYFRADDSGLARPHVRLLRAALPTLRVPVQIENNIKRGRRDLRDVAEARGRPLPEGLPVQRDESRRIPRWSGEQTTIPRSWSLRVQVSRIRCNYCTIQLIVRLGI